jgi:hypothetical protein
MTTHTVKGAQVFSCDFCSETFEAGEGDDFGVAWADARAQGWSARKNGAVWTHHCPSCNPRGAR